MGSPRHDVQRLFRHFGLDPSEYVDTFLLKSAVVVSSATPLTTASAECGLQARGDSDLFDHRNFELGR